MPITRRPCSIRPCVKWVEGEWSAVSRSQTKPRKSRKSDWDTLFRLQCSKTCDVGRSQRQVLCQAYSGKYLPDDNCSHLGQKPAVVKECNHQACDVKDCNHQACASKRRYKWKAESWSPVSFFLIFSSFFFLLSPSQHYFPIFQCSRTCGVGGKTRSVKCVIANQENNEIQRFGGPWVDDSYCDQQNRPKEKKKCTRKFCPYTWIESEWSEVRKAISWILNLMLSVPFLILAVYEKVRVWHAE